jgi:hypothetical protein
VGGNDGSDIEAEPEAGAWQCWQDRIMLSRSRLVEPEACAPEAESEERRQSQRLRTVYRVARVVRDRAAGLWRVRNISDFGMMLLTRARPKRGETLSVALSDQVSISARVIWCSDDSCGIAFDQPIDSAALLRSLASEAAAASRRPLRLDADMAATTWGERGIQPVRIGNLSQHGLGFTHDGWARIDMKLLVQFDNGVQRRGIVRWCDGDQAGVQLLDPFTCEDLASVAPGRS